MRLNYTLVVVLLSMVMATVAYNAHKRGLSYVEVQDDTPYTLNSEDIQRDCAVQYLIVYPDDLEGSKMICDGVLRKW